VIKENGEFVPGDLSVSLVARELAHRETPGPIATTVATTHILQEIARETNREVIITEVGDLVVAKALQEHGGIFGCEENGGMISPILCGEEMEPWLQLRFFTSWPEKENR